eukprot:TRINITY_DN50878_c0_g1_i1.p1 TRINITY_DN50878_c0_g1~~TRINITY_DN50878_c0_g1_i1.p1  ORF type:complete len:498 (-),score=94.42 TRINITY_DN50878_c0_g1_i1:38-1531(-)
MCGLHHRRTMPGSFRKRQQRHERYEQTHKTYPGGRRLCWRCEQSRGCRGGRSRQPRCWLQRCELHVLDVQLKLASLKVEVEELLHLATPEAAEFAEALQQVHRPEELWNLRRKLDSNLVFSAGGHLVCLHGIVKCLDETSRKNVLRHIKQTVATSDCQFFSECYLHLLTDVDDTIMPGDDALHIDIAGCDRSVPHGILYPGVLEFHKQLRGQTDDAYSVCLTARPPLLLKALPKKLSALCGSEGQPERLAILPGGSHLIENTIKILKGNQKVVTRSSTLENISEYQKRLRKFQALGEKKVQRFEEYWRLFPELAGRFVFIGDDGQADLTAAERMLEMKDESGLPLLAFTAIHTVSLEPPLHLVPTKTREELVAMIRERNPGNDRARFFYFTDYNDLAKQLLAEGWIGDEQYNSIAKAYEQDKEQILLHEKRVDFGPGLFTRCSVCAKPTRNRGDQVSHKIYCESCFRERPNEVFINDFKSTRMDVSADLASESMHNT